MERHGEAEHARPRPRPQALAFKSVAVELLEAFDLVHT
jgi:hypothetical protein